MRELRGNLAIAGILLGLLCAATPTGAATTATVNVTITVLPFASVTLSQETPLTVTISQGQTTWSVAVGGTVLCNCPVSLFAAVTPPTGAPGGWTWNASTRVATIETGGVYDYTGTGNELLTVTAEGSEANAGTFSLTFTGQSLPKGSTPASPPEGNVVVTVMPG